MLLKIQVSFNSGSAHGEPTRLISLQQMLQITLRIQLKNLPFCSLGAGVPGLTAATAEALHRGRDAETITAIFWFGFTG